MAAATTIHGDARQLPLDDCAVDAVICDPPYELTGGSGGGFMGKKWDATGVAFDPATWREALRVLKPGGFLLAFGGMRTQHRLICAIEDAGFEIRDAIVWHFASGFPKSLAVDKAIDRAAGAEREVIGRYARPDGSAVRDNVTAAKFSGTAYNGGRVGGDGNDGFVTAPATDEARRWQGFGTALKPASEIICVARKPLAGKTVAQNVLTYGCGALNIDATRVAMADTDPRRQWQKDYGGRDYGAADNDIYAPMMSRTSPGSPLGRWPSNVVFSHPPRLDVDGQVIGDACADGCVDGCPVLELDGQSGTTKDGVAVHRNRPGGAYQAPSCYGEFGNGARSDIGYGGSGGASRFFPTFRYVAKAPSKERPKVNGVAHPCVKPLELLKFLARLVGGQPGSLILDPFAGSGSTIEAALLEGFNAVGVEQAAEYLPLIQLRIDRATAELAAQQPRAEPEPEPTLFDVA